MSTQTAATPSYDSRPQVLRPPSREKKPQRPIASCHAATPAVFIWQHGRQHQPRDGWKHLVEGDNKGTTRSFSVFNSASRVENSEDWLTGRDAEPVQAGASIQGSTLILIGRLLPHKLFRFFLAGEAAAQVVPAVPGAYGWVPFLPTNFQALDTPGSQSPSCFLVRLDTGV